MKVTLEKLLSDSRKAYGDVIIDPNTIVPCDIIPTGSLAVDIATRRGGVPRGRVVEVYGAESSGKTTLALQIVAQAQKAGGLVAYIDAEHALDGTYAKNLGVDLDKLIMAQPEDAEQTFDIVKDFASSELFTLIVVDSVAALVPKAVLNGVMEDQHMGVMARLMSKAMQKLVGPLATTNTTLLLINQVRSTMSSSYLTGPPETTTGGKALKFYASMRIQVSRGSAVKDGDVAHASVVRIKVVKNKIAAPFGEAESEIEFGVGFNLAKEIINFGTELHLIEKSGSWYSYNGERIGQGMANAAGFLDMNPHIRNEIESKIRQRYGL